ncbi:Ger(x)C family spore germination C-terminal domain-containing protein [Cohnella silvisoli]|uniref:Ger(X)C family spore germination C-terminal domain-containing protein n=1 Tax=Cohnella silvisoli TaxID=2873699 RepID=A0ABV1L128_9BACL|nr:Ger(x)C family spore germination C-terminal domain-containing protein [Cohnella silvisoli]MCD9025281.1 Ger(x)C family spore germination protein [Cohnella silvisoli]
MGVSYQDQIYKVILLIPKPVAHTTRIRNISGTGKTITQAVDNISVDMESSVDLLHLKVIIFDKKYAQHGVTDSITGFMRARDISPKAIVVICDEDLDLFFPKVQKTMEPKGTPLYDSFEKNAGWNPQVALTRVWQVYRSIHSFTHDVAIPIVKSGKSTVIEHIGSAMIKNGKMVDRISSDETLLFNAFNGESAQGKIEVLDHASVLIVNNTIKNRSKLTNNRPYLKSKIKLKVSLLETRGNPSNQVIKDELVKLLTKRFNRMLTKVQTREADILGLGQFFRNKIRRDQLQHWRTDYLPYLKMDFQMDIVIQNEGNLKMTKD